MASALTQDTFLKGLKKIFVRGPQGDFTSELIPRSIKGTRLRHPSLSDVVTPFPSALAELKRRAADPDLRAKVEAYLGHDIPAYFAEEPVLYLCRHVASPNIQTLRFIKMMRAEGMKTVIGQDTKDLFVSNNQLKKALGKLPICIDIHRKGNRLIEVFRKVSIIDFNVSNGTPLHTVRTLWGEPLVEFHNRLFAELADESVHIEDDSSWVDRYDRGDLLGEYKKFLALFLVHGIMFEDYPIEASESEAEFVSDILRPAVAHIEAEFGLRPLIAPLVPAGKESTEVWEGYPPKTLEILKEKMPL